MHAKLIQTYSHTNAFYELQHEHQIFYRAMLTPYANFCAFETFKAGTPFLEITEHSDDKYHRFDLIRDEQICGELYTFKEFMKPLKIALHIDSRKYIAYPINIGNNVFACAIYDGSQLIGLIEKHGEIDAHRDIFDVYWQDSIYSDIIALFGFYCDAVFYQNRGNYRTGKRNLRIKKANRKTLQMYNPMFKDLCE